MAISCCSKCAKTFEEGLDGDMPPVCPKCYREHDHDPNEDIDGDEVRELDRAAGRY